MSVRSPANVTTTDLLKLAGLAFVFIDHIGLFFAPDQEWWRVVGRAAAPVFFFLIGFARTRSIPLSWIVLGSVLTALDAYVSEDWDDVTLNILFNFALIRLATPAIETRMLATKQGGRWGFALLALFCAAMIPLAGMVLEYGAEGWLWALFGLAAGEAAMRGDAFSRMRRNLMATFCAAVYLFVEIRDFAFEPAAAGALAALICALAFVLARFRRADAPFGAPAPVARALGWIGRRSLEIYAVSLFLMQLAGHLLDGSADAGEE